jgi:chaperone required for assembly of F1-ATPase
MGREAKERSWPTTFCSRLMNRFGRTDILAFGAASHAAIRSGQRDRHSAITDPITTAAKMKPVQSGIARSYQGNGRLKTIAARVKSVADVIATTKKASGTECKLIAVGPVIASWRTNFGSNIAQATQPSTQMVPTALCWGHDGAVTRKAVSIWVGANGPGRGNGPGK